MGCSEAAGGLLAGSSRSLLNTTHGRGNTVLASEGR